MTPPSTRKWLALPAAAKDIERLAHDDQRLALRAVTLLDLLAEERIVGQALRNTAFYGDLSDCFKYYFGVTDVATHRIVYRKLPGGAIEVIEAIAVEQREDGYVYLLAASRLETLPDSSSNALTRIHQQVIKRRSDKRRNR